MSYLLFALKEKTAGLPRYLKNYMQRISKKSPIFRRKMHVSNLDDLMYDAQDRYDAAYRVAPIFTKGWYAPAKQDYVANLITKNQVGKNLSRSPASLPPGERNEQAPALLRQPREALVEEMGYNTTPIRYHLEDQKVLEKKYKEEALHALNKRMADLKKKQDAEFEKSMESILSRIRK